MSAEEATMLNHDAAVLDDRDPRLLEPKREGIVANAGLEPHQAGPDDEDVTQMLAEKLAASEDIYHVDRWAHLGERRAHRLLPEHPTDVDGVDRKHMIAPFVQVGRDVGRRLRRIGVRTKHRDAARGSKCRTQVVLGAHRVHRYRIVSALAS
jgi:hypothetical protein